MDLDKLKDAASNAVGGAKDATSGALDSARGALKDEEKTDAALDRAADAANSATGGKFANSVDKARQFADDRLGDELK